MFLALALLLAAPTTPASSPSHTATTTIADTLPQGTVGLSFGFPAGGSFNPFGGPAGAPADIGLTYFIAPQNAVRLDVGLALEFSSPLPGGSTTSAFDISLGYRMYRGHYGPLWVFLQPGIGFGRASGAEFLNIGGAVGAEYFFADHFSVGGMLGLALNLNNLGGPAGSNVGASLNTGTSGLFASAYF